MKFRVKDCDPNTGEPDDEGYEDEYVVSLWPLFTIASLQGSPWSWKVMEYRKTIFQAWKVMENSIGHGKSWKSHGK